MKKIEKLLVQHIEIEVHYKKIKNTYLRIKQDGKLMISAPHGTKSNYLVKYVESRMSWIMENQQILNERRKITSQLAEDEILLFGKPFKGSLSKVELEKLLHEKITFYYEKYWPPFKKYGCEPAEIKYRMMKSTWGIYRPIAGTITFNKRLVHQPDSFIEYVVLHEMCHLLISNHGPLFYQLVSIHMPDFKEYEDTRVIYNVE